jgi:hypothetical protein
MKSSIENLDVCQRDNFFNNNFDLTYILNKFCYIERENDIIIDHYFFKQYIKITDNSINTLNHLINQIEKVLKNYDNFNVHLKIKSLTLIEIDKHKDLISMMSLILKQKFPDKLKNCLIYDAPFIFSSLFSIISPFIDKDTQKKMRLIK